MSHEIDTNDGTWRAVPSPNFPPKGVVTLREHDETGKMTAIWEKRWEEPLPDRPGFYLAPRTDLDTVRTVVELLNSPAGQWVDAGDHTYLSHRQVRALGPLHRLVIAGQVRPEDLDMVESDDFITGLIDENRQLQERLNELRDTK